MNIPEVYTMKTLLPVILSWDCVFLAMACIRVDGHEVPLVFSVDGGGRARVDNHLLHVRFRFF